MYDTVSAVLTEVPSWVMDERLWRRERSSTDPDTGEVHRTRFLNVTKGPLLTLHDGGRLSAERSLPKALRGENVTEIVQGEVEPALAVVDAEIADALGPGLPPFADWLPSRVDYCHNEALGDDALVLRRLGKLSQVDLPYKGFPVVGSSRSVTWPRGEVRLKAYSKSLETKGDPRAAGVLRWEAGVVRARGLRNLMAAVGIGDHYRHAASSTMEPSAGVLGGFEDGCEVRPGLRVLDVLVPEMHSAALGRYLEFLRGGVMSADEMSDVALVRELVEFFRPGHAAVVIGWCCLLRAFGARSRGDLVTVNIGGVATRYRILADMRAFRCHLVEKGLAEPDAEEDEYLAGLMARLAMVEAAA